LTIIGIKWIIRKKLLQRFSTVYQAECEILSSAHKKRKRRKKKKKSQQQQKNDPIEEKSIENENENDEQRSHALSNEDTNSQFQEFEFQHNNNRNIDPNDDNINGNNENEEQSDKNIDSIIQHFPSNSLDPANESEDENKQIATLSTTTLSPTLTLEHHSSDILPNQRNQHLIFQVLKVITYSCLLYFLSFSFSFFFSLSSSSSSSSSSSLIFFSSNKIVESDHEQD
jgi:hypothetical protein